jgi:hypothetical protein
MSPLHCAWAWSYETSRQPTLKIGTGYRLYADRHGLRRFSVDATFAPTGFRAIAAATGSGVRFVTLGTASITPRRTSVIVWSPSVPAPSFDLLIMVFCFPAISVRVTVAVAV